jgi:hypothetical protein
VLSSSWGAYLRGQVEPEIAVVSKAVLDEQRDLVAEAELHLTAETRGFAEVDEVLEREGQGDGLGKTDLDVLLGVLDVGVLAQGDGAVANVTSAGKLYALLCALDGDCLRVSGLSIYAVLVHLTRLGQGRQIPGDLGELGARHGDRCSVFGVRDTQMLLVNVHELDVVLAQPVALRALEHQVDNIRRILGFQCEDVIVLCAAQDLGERGEVDAERKVAIAAERREGFGLEHHGNEGDVGVVHGLERDTGVIAVEVAVLDEILDGVDDLRGISAYAIGASMAHVQTYLLQQVCLLEACFQHCDVVSSVFACRRMVTRTLDGLCGGLW